MNLNGVSRRAAVCVMLTLLLTVAAGAQNTTSTLTELFGFPYDASSGLYPNGNAPWGTLIQASDGNFYGTTYQGGSYGGGTVFKITAAGQLSLVYSFQHGSSGSNPSYSGLVEAGDGNLYGVTNSSAAGGTGYGSVFRVTKSGAFTTLYNFCQLANCADGWSALGSLIQARDGGLYGTAESGGTYGGGVIFRITTAGVYTPLYSMNPGAGDSCVPLGGLTQASDGNFYGVTNGSGCDLGAVFRITPSGTFTALYHFGTSPGDGQRPYFPPIQASDGNLYGTTWSNGGSPPFGTVYKMSLDGALTTLYTFTCGADGGLPAAGLIQASDGNLWGAAETCGGLSNYGTVYTVSTSGTLLQSLPLDGPTTGWSPVMGLVQGAGGALYGVAPYGGTDSNGNSAYGTIFTVKAGLPKPKAHIAAFSPASGTIGSKVLIRGYHFIGASAVTFNGVSAAFRVNNTSYITAVVPVGATTGPITVTNPGGTAVSKASFTVQ